MGKKAAAPPPEEPPEEQPVEVEQPTEYLEGDFAFPDGSEYCGEYMKKGDKVTLHGKGRLKIGPEVFQGTFDNGLYREGTFTGADGSVYKGSFHNNLFHGPGEYAWPDGRIYRGMWQEGLMHGRGEFENFSFGVDRFFRGFCARGSFASSLQGQENARRDYVAEYSAAYEKSALAALQDIATRAAAAAEPADPKAKKGLEEGPAEVPKEYLVAPGDDNGEATEAASEASGIVAGPFPDSSNLRVSTLAAFASRFVDGAENPGTVTVFDETAAASTATAGSGDGSGKGNSPQTGVGANAAATADGEGVGGGFDASRLRQEQLAHRGQGVAFAAPDAEPGTPSLLVFVNVCTEYDAAKAIWKLVHCEDAPQQPT